MLRLRPHPPGADGDPNLYPRAAGDPNRGADPGANNSFSVGLPVKLLFVPYPKTAYGDPDLSDLPNHRSLNGLHSVIIAG